VSAPGHSGVAKVIGQSEATLAKLAALVQSEKAGCFSYPGDITIPDMRSVGNASEVAYSSLNTSVFAIPGNHDYISKASMSGLCFFEAYPAYEVGRHIASLSADESAPTLIL